MKWAMRYGGDIYVSEDRNDLEVLRARMHRDGASLELLFIERADPRIIDTLVADGYYVVNIDTKGE